MRKDRIVPNDRPAVVLLAGPEFQAVCAFSRKVDRKPHAPCGDDQRIDGGAQTHAAFDRDDPRVDDRQDAPELVHLREILRKLADDKAVRDGASAHDQQNCQRCGLLRGKRGTSEHDPQNKQRQYDDDGHNRPDFSFHSYP